MFRNTLTAAAIFAASVTAAFAGPAISIEDAYARSAMKHGKSGAAFLIIRNTGDEADQLIDAQSQIAHKVELHTHKDMGGGVMKMMHVPEGFTIPAGGTHVLKRGGDHVMFMGLKQPMAQGEMVKVMLEFEKSGTIEIEVPVDLDR